MNEPEANQKKDKDDPRTKKLKLDNLDNKSILDYEDDKLDNDVTRLVNSACSADSSKKIYLCFWTLRHPLIKMMMVLRFCPN